MLSLIVNTFEMLPAGRAGQKGSLCQPKGRGVVAILFCFQDSSRAWSQRYAKASVSRLLTLFPNISMEMPRAPKSRYQIWEHMTENFQLNSQYTQSFSSV